MEACAPGVFGDLGPGDTIPGDFGFTYVVVAGERGERNPVACDVRVVDNPGLIGLENESLRCESASDGTLGPGVSPEALREALSGDSANGRVRVVRAEGGVVRPTLCCAAGEAGAWPVGWSPCVGCVVVCGSCSSAACGVGVVEQRCVFMDIPCARQRQCAPQSRTTPRRLTSAPVAPYASLGEPVGRKK